MKQISPEELRERLKKYPDLSLLDVREVFEHQAFNIGGELMPMSELFEHIEAIPRDREVIVYCKMGIRSQIAIQRLEERFGYNNLVNLQGGVEAWKKLP